MWLNRFIPLKNIYNTKIFDLKENEGQNANKIKNFLMGVSDKFLTTNCNAGSWSVAQSQIVHFLVIRYRDITIMQNISKDISVMFLLNFLMSLRKNSLFSTQLYRTLSALVNSFKVCQTGCSHPTFKFNTSSFCSRSLNPSSGPWYSYLYRHHYD